MRTTLRLVTTSPDVCRCPKARPLSLEPALGTAIGMMNQAVDALMPTRPDRHLQRIERQIRTQVIRDLPAKNAAGEQIHHERGINPARKRIHVRDIRDPPPVRRRRLEAPLQQVRRVRRGSPGTVVRGLSAWTSPRQSPAHASAAPPCSAPPECPAGSAPAISSGHRKPPGPSCPSTPPLPFPSARHHGFPVRRNRLAFLRVVIRRHGKFQDREAGSTPNRSRCAMALP